MGERAHTPGPWLIELDNFGDYTVHREHETLAIAAVVNGEMRRMGGLSHQHEANALLVSAAPDMFEAAHALLFHLELYDFNERDPSGKLNERMAGMKAALAKAEGLGRA